MVDSYKIANFRKYESQGALRRPRLQSPARRNKEAPAAPAGLDARNSRPSAKEELRFEDRLNPSGFLKKPLYRDHQTVHELRIKVLELQSELAEQRSLVESLRDEEARSQLKVTKLESELQSLAHVEQDLKLQINDLLAYCLNVDFLRFPAPACVRALLQQNTVFNLRVDHRDLYTGQTVRDNLMHGKGEYMDSDGLITEGTWVNGKIHGDAIIHHASPNLETRAQYSHGEYHGLLDNFYPGLRKHVVVFMAGGLSEHVEHEFVEGQYHRLSCMEKGERHGYQLMYRLSENPEDDNVEVSRFEKGVMMGQPRIFTLNGQAD